MSRIDPKNILRVGAAVLLSGLAACVSTYRDVMVVSRSATGYYYVRTDIWNTMGFDDPAKRNAPGAMRFYGPVDIHWPPPFMEGSQYVIAPICGGQVDWAKSVRPVIRENAVVHIEC